MRRDRLLDVTLRLQSSICDAFCPQFVPNLTVRHRSSRLCEIHNTWRRSITPHWYGQRRGGGRTMEQGDLINLLENLLGPAAAGVGPPRQARPYHDDEAQDSYLDANDEAPSLPGAPHPSMTGLLSAVMPIGIVIVETSTGAVVRINKMLLRMLGVKEAVESMAGRRLNQIA